MDKNGRNLRYSLRKLSIGLVSVLIGLNIVENNKPQKVKADTLSSDADQETDSGSMTNNKADFAFLGQIIPIDQQQQEIKNAPQPYYKRDPNDSSKALATPAPRIDGYSISKKKQVANYDTKTNLVTPPADPSQNTYLIYDKNKTKQEKINKNSSAVVTSPEPKIRTKKSRNQVKNSENLMVKKVYSNSRTTNKATNTPSEEVRESVQTTRLFGFGKKKHADDVTNDTQNITNNEQDSNLSQANDEQNIKAEHDTALKSAAKNKKTGSNKTNEKKQAKKSAGSSDHKKTNKKGHKPKPPVAKTTKTEVIMNPKIKMPPKPLIATLKMLDQDNNDEEVTELTFEGYQGDRIVFDNLKQVIEIHNYDGYENAALINQNNDEKIAIDDLDHLDLGEFADKDVTFILYFKHKLLRLTKENASGANLAEVSLTVDLIVHYEGAGSATPSDQIEVAKWSRERTYDVVLKKIVPGKFDTDWTADPKEYEAITVPKIEGYQADITKIDAMPVSMQSIKKVVQYHKIAEPTPAPEVKKVIPQKTEAVTKESKLVVTFSGAADLTPEAQIQVIKWTKKDDDWIADKTAYQDIKVPVVNGYHADRQLVKGPKVEEDDLEIAVTYAKNGAFIPSDEQGNAIGERQVFITDPADASKVLPAEKLNKIPGYQAPATVMDPANAGEDQQIFYQKEKQELQVDLDHPNDAVDASQYQKQIIFTVRFSGAGEQTPAPIVQKVPVVRSITVDEQGNIIPDGQYSTAWQAEREYFADVQVPKLVGFTTEQDVIKGPKVGLEDIEQVVEYQKDEPIKPEKENKFEEIIHFVDAQGNKLAPDHTEVLSFKQNNGTWDKTVATFKSVTVPVVAGYFAESKQAKGKSVMPMDTEQRLEVTIKYYPMGKIIPIDIDGKVIRESDRPAIKLFENDPTDASRALNRQVVPQIDGWKAKVETVSPANPAINIPVLYQSN